MKNLKIKKIKIAKINNLSMILGGNRQTIIQGCMPDTHTCPPRETHDPNYTTCHTTNNGTLAGNPTTGGFAETDQCGSGRNSD
ncbi:hypothetical protein [uncultured Kordia sp.]|uniref:hypothetical protein n=1 Tax=uncultured Kordia sp. TaxID=507699 RepID=UPI0026233224|nr:hypothetical protein [uncultured Kordia sp.]